VRFREIDALGYFSTRLLGQVALPSVTAAAQQREERIRAKLSQPAPGTAERIRRIIEDNTRQLLRGALETSVVALRVCACARMVPESEWVYPYDCCPDCAERAMQAADNWREAWFERDRERLIAVQED
jgi:hypothetical protein